VTRVAFTMRSDSGQVIEALSTTIDNLEDLEPFFRELEPDWWESRKAVYDTQGQASDTDWPLYSATEESKRYVFAKGSMVGLDGPIGDDDVLLWGGPSRLHDAVTGVSSEGYWIAEQLSATATVDVEHASNHDEGKGTAPEWAWPRGIPYTNPLRRLTAMGGTGPYGFQRLFAIRLGEHLGEQRIGLRSADLTRELIDTWAPMEGSA